MKDEIFKYPTADREYIYSDISLENLAKKWGLDFKKLSQQATDEDWEGRKERFQEMLAEEDDLQNVEPKKLMNFRHLKLYRLILKKARKMIADNDFESVEKASEAADKAIKGERLVVGEATERREETLGVDKATLKEIGNRIINERMKKDD